MGFTFSSVLRALRVLSTPRNFLAVSIATFCLFFLLKKLDGINLAEVELAISAIEPWQWAAAFVATALSFATVGQYDALFHRWLKTGVSAKRAIISGASSIALAQTAGFGLITGTLARWRMLPDLSLSQAFKLTNYVSISFMVALGVVVAAALAVSPSAGATTSYGFASVAITILVVAVALSFWRPSWLPFELPPIGLAGRLLALTTLDIAFAALALFILLPLETEIAFSTLLVAYAVALSAGLLTGSPGGVGPFELCLIAMLPSLAEPDLVAAVLGYRLVYYAIPACIALIFLARPQPADKAHRSQRKSRSVIVRAEAMGLARQHGHQIAFGTHAALHMAEASQTLVSIGDPASGGRLKSSDFDLLRTSANETCRFPAFYKIGPRSAAIARNQGWTVMPVSEEAWLDPRHFTTDGSKRRQLRRKLKHAEKAMVKVVSAPELPLEQMAQVADGWRSRNGGERGFSMGRFDAAYVGKQKCFLAYANNRLIAFVTFHSSKEEWVLDLMRSRAELPDGTMHALLHTAIETAKAAGVVRLSLAAMPLAHPAKVVKLAQDMDGLRRFKLCFAPNTTPLYLAAPNAFVLGIAAADILCQIRFPSPLNPPPPSRVLQKLQSRFAGMAVVPETIPAHLSGEQEMTPPLELSQ